ncbi:hypothetical protein T02_11098 [Trichinella nativa]|uniref:Uncharacterized protein n=1 Tax=Trichinella nativa TaxID=6335 RepID=A0A0V1KHS6_9BILA|nr:hypothetical protein T02_11098 [Trichinella nativa]
MNLSKTPSFIRLKERSVKYCKLIRAVANCAFS